MLCVGGGVGRDSGQNDWIAVFFSFSRNCAHIFSPKSLVDFDIRQNRLQLFKMAVVLIFKERYFLNGILF